MSKNAWSDRQTLPGPREFGRMVRVSPLTIGAVYKTEDKAGQGYVLNLSRGGVFLTTDVVFEMGQRLRVRFFLPFQLGQVDADVEVRWRTRDVPNPPPGLPSGFGLAFVDVDASTQDRIGQFIKKFVELAEQLES